MDHTGQFMLFEGLRVNRGLARETLGWLTAYLSFPYGAAGLRAR
jgi:hypothetical protein